MKQSNTQHQEEKKIHVLNQTKMCLLFFFVVVVSLSLCLICLWAILCVVISKRKNESVTRYGSAQQENRANIARVPCAL